MGPVATYSTYSQAGVVPATCLRPHCRPLYWAKSNLRQGDSHVLHKIAPIPTSMRQVWPDPVPGPANKVFRLGGGGGSGGLSLEG